MAEKGMEGTVVVVLESSMVETQMMMKTLTKDLAGL